MKNESGRTLTEMMGTLAIIGILAIAGIWMYNSAMDKLKANTIINEAQKRAVVVAGQIGFQGRTNPTLGEFSDNTFAGSTFSTDVVTSGLYGQFGIKVENVSKNVCQNILNSIGEDTPIRRLSKETNPTGNMAACTDNNTFLIVYNNNMSTQGGDTEYGNNDCACQTACGQCVIENGTQKCVNECPVGGNTCTSNTDCQGECVGCVIPSGQSQGTCQACQRAEYLEATGTQYISTGIYINPTDTLRAEYIITFTDPTTRQLQGYSGGGTGYWGVTATGVYELGKASSSIQPQEKDFIIFNKLVRGSGSYSFNLSVNSTTAQEKNNVSTKEKGPFQLFALNAGYKTKAKMYSMRLYVNDDLVRDFVPVYAPFQPANKKNCMYDKVSKTLFCSETSDFDTNLDN